ncbi:VOC family protein [Halovivax gelatinilyticus]|uniref:VOC family protein n=1 Tax=Halovivax gelatinilyticus TaxID=2961597 RepID=UPI0020CA4D14|nr:VOC family protein [Halovivax gelatinilyticus]
MTGDPHLVGHVHLKVSDLEAASEFYTEVLGLSVTESHGRFRFLSWGERHHDVALQEVRPDAPGPNDGVGLYHAAMEVPDGASLAAVYERVRARGVDVSAVDHGISKAIYFSDPAGNGLEIYLDTREENDQPHWSGTNRSFDPEGLAADR